MLQRVLANEHNFAKPNHPKRHARISIRQTFFAKFLIFMLTMVTDTHHVGTRVPLEVDI